MIKRREKMKLKFFRIQSYRSCVDTEINFNEELTSLIGVNGAGKTNILNGLLLLNKMVNSGFGIIKLGDNYNQSKIDFELTLEKKSIQIKGVMFYDTDEHNTNYVKYSYFSWNFNEFINIPNWIKIPSGFFDLVVLSPLNIQDSKLISEINNFNGLSENYIDLEKFAVIFQIFNKVIEYLNQIKYYSASEFSNPSECPSSLELEDNRLIRKNGNFQPHDKFILDVFNKFHENGFEYKRFI